MAGCATVSVTPSSSGIRPASREPGCAIELLRAVAPEREYDEIAAIRWEGPAAGQEEAEEAVRANACALGADAVVVNRAFGKDERGFGLMTGTAITYR